MEEGRRPEYPEKTPSDERHCSLATSVAKWDGVRLGSSMPGFEPIFSHGAFSRSSHTSVLKIGTPVATLPGAWHYWVSARTGLPGVCIL